MRTCRIVATTRWPYIAIEREPLARRLPAVFIARRLRGEKIMGALKIRETDFTSVERRPELPAQPNYDEEITREQIENARLQVAPLLDDDEWIMVDGPAW